MSRTARALLRIVLLLYLCSPGSLRRTGSHIYPPSGHIYPPSGTGHRTSTTNNPFDRITDGINACAYTYPRQSPCHLGNNVHRLYYYTPPLHNIQYVFRDGSVYSYPVYRAHPPSYVYQYRDSSSKYGTLLTGLALFNLGMLTAFTYSNYKNQHYHSPPGEVCKLVIRRQNGDYEETKIKCELISSFIWAEEKEKRTQAVNLGMNSSNSFVIQTAINTTTTIFDNGSPASTVTSASPIPMYTFLPNGTLVQVNAISMDSPAAPNNNLMTSSNTAVTEAFDPKNDGPPVQVTNGMRCYLSRHSPYSNSRYTIPCGLLETYASKSFTYISPIIHSIVDFLTVISGLRLS